MGIVVFTQWWIAPQPIDVRQHLQRTVAVQEIVIPAVGPTQCFGGVEEIDGHVGPQVFQDAADFLALHVIFSVHAPQPQRVHLHPIVGGAVKFMVARGGRIDQPIVEQRVPVCGCRLPQRTIDTGCFTANDAIDHAHEIHVGITDINAGPHRKPWQSFVDGSHDPLRGSGVDRRHERAFLRQRTKPLPDKGTAGLHLRQPMHCTGGVDGGAVCGERRHEIRGDCRVGKVTTAARVFLFGTTGVLFHLKEGLFDRIEQPTVDAWTVGVGSRCGGQGSEEEK